MTPRVRAQAVLDRCRDALRALARGDATADAILELEQPTKRDTPPRRALWAFACFALGVILGDAIDGPPAIALFAGGALLALPVLALRGLSVVPFVALSAVLLGAGHIRSTVHEVPSNDVAFALTDKPEIIRVRGTIHGPIEFRDTLPGAMAQYAFGGSSTRFRLACDTLTGREGETRNVTGTLTASVDGDARDRLRAGQRVRVTGRARSLGEPMNPGGFDAQRWGAVNGFSGRITLDSPELIETIGDAPAPILAHIESWLDARARTWMGDPGDSPERALIAAMLLGDRGDALEETESTFRRVGLAHVLAISGLHVGVMIFLALMALRLTGDRPRLHALILLVAIAAYILIVPARTPIVRTAILSLAFVAAELGGRRYDRITLLAWVGLAVLFWKPTELFSAGFHLSFAIVAALMLLHAPVRARLFGYRSPAIDRDDARPVRSWIARWAQDLIVASIVSWAVSVPIVAHHFGLVPLLGIASSIVVLPVIVLLVALGYLALAVGLVSTLGASAIMSAMLPIASFSLWLAGLFEALPLAEIAVPTPSILWIALALPAIAWWLVRGTVRAPTGYAITTILALSAIIAWNDTGVRANTALRIDMLSVGDGTCILLRTEDDALLYDAGSRYPGLGLRTIPDALRALGVRTVERAVISHPNTDHMNALPDCARRIGLREVIVGKAMHDHARSDPDGAARYFLDALRAQGMDVRTTHAGETIALGEITFQILSPPEGRLYESANDNSLVLRARIETLEGPVTLLLTGDIERGAIADLLDTHPDLRADITEVPHHGSARPSAMAFVESIDPEIALQSTGPSRLDDERWDFVRAGRTWPITARDGAISVVIKRTEGVEVRTVTKPGH